MITVDQLFAEDFKPQWMMEKERLEYESYLFSTSAAIEFNWRKNAERIHKKISEKYKPVENCSLN